MTKNYSRDPLPLDGCMRTTSPTEDDCVIELCSSPPSASTIYHTTGIPPRSGQREFTCAHTLSIYMSSNTQTHSTHTHTPNTQTHSAIARTDTGRARLGRGYFAPREYVCAAVSRLVYLSNAIRGIAHTLYMRVYMAYSSSYNTYCCCCWYVRVACNVI